MELARVTVFQTAYTKFSLSACLYVRALTRVRTHTQGSVLCLYLGVCCGPSDPHSGFHLGLTRPKAIRYLPSGPHYI